MKRFQTWTLWACACLLLGCGSGGGGGITPTPDFTLSASTTSLSLPAGSSTSLPLSTSALNGFTGNITIQASGLPAGVTTTPTLPLTLAVPGSQSVTVSALATVATGDYPITVSGVSGGLSHSVNGTLTIQASLQFSLNASPTTSSVVAGNSTTFQLSMSADSGFNSDVTIQVTGMPFGMTLSPSLPFSWNGPASRTVTVNADTTVAAGNYTLTFTGSTSSGLTHSTTETVSVQPPPPPSFTLNVTPPSLTLAAGTVGTFQISVVPANGFSGQVNVQITGLPANTSLAPSSPFSITASPQTVTVATTMALAAGPYNLSIQGSSGALSASGTETLNVQTATPPPSRSDFVGTNDNPQAMAYDKLHQRVYVTNPIAGTVDVISSTTYQMVQQIPVPQPYGIDITPDYSTVFIGTNTQAVYAMDTATLALTARYIAPLQMPDSTSPTYLWATPLTNPVATPDNSALISLFGLPLANGRIVKWNPKTGKTTTVVSSASFPLGGPQYPEPMGRTPMFPSAVSIDHTKVIVTNDLSSSTVYLFDTATNKFVQNIVIGDYIGVLAANPNGTQFAAGGGSVYILDANLNIINVIPVPGVPVYSADGKSLYVSYQPNEIPELAIYDTTTFNQVGTTPDFSVALAGRDPAIWQEFPLTVDETGCIFGSMINGMSIVDATNVRTFGSGLITPDSNFLANPDTGPVGISQTVQIETQVYSPDALPNVWFGQLPSSNTTYSGYLTTVAPPSSQGGIVNIRIERQDHVQAWVPQGYTYGAVLWPMPDFAAANDGSTTIDLYGYGLDPYSSSAPATTVRFGNHRGTVRGYRNITGSAPPYDLSVQPPQMPVGVSDVTATSASGSSTLHSVFHAVEVHTAALGQDETAASLAYDAGRKQVYVAVTDEVEVFSPSGNLITTFAIPTLNGQKKLGGMALTPDGKWLLVTNTADASIAVINPDSPSSATAVGVGNTSPGGGPVQAAATNTSQVFILANGTWVLDLNTMTVTPSTNIWVGGYSITASPDGSKVCTGYRQMNLYDSATGSLTFGPSNYGSLFCHVNGGIVVSSDGINNQIGTVRVSNMSLAPVSTGGLTKYEFSELCSSGGAQTGLAAGNTGALAYMLCNENIVLFDAHNGDYRERITLPDMSLPLQTYQLNALAINETGDQMYAITAGGLTTVQLDSLPLAIGSITTSSGTWNISGTGFISGTAVAVDGKSLSVTFTDSQHIQVAGAPGLNTAHTIKLTNPDGHTYTYDAAYFR